MGGVGRNGSVCLETTRDVEPTYLISYTFPILIDQNQQFKEMIRKCIHSAALVLQSRLAW